MRIFTTALILLTIHAHAQYNGTYEYSDPATLQIATSPKDHQLYAIIKESKYLLKVYNKDTFLNGSNQQVIFKRDNNKITGYTVDGHTYRRLNNTVTFQWYARKDTHWNYRIPADRHDGLTPGSLNTSGVDTARIHTLISRIIDNSYPDVHSILLVKDGKLILEEYFYGYTENTTHQLRSATKSVSSAMIGLAIQKGLINSVQDKVVSFFPDYNITDSIKNTITIRDLMTQQSGFACDDTDPNSPGNEVKIYPTDDWIKYILNLPMTHIPGTTAAYCSGNTLLIDRIVEKASGQSLSAFAKDNLFAPLGITRFKWNFQPDKTQQDEFGQLYLRPRDMAKIGMLFLNKGKWKEKQLIPEAFVQESFSKQSVVEDIDYGYTWWLETLKNIPGIAAKGNGGQRIFIWPGLNMVAVITAGNYNQQSPANRLLIECVL
ncbi:serine hydrolase [Chitinophaga sp. LS1]|uniref:serine hydrolase domain-containing protein n=1 Tax=Chitinophaga sp. LS1 TaxID=3051176 RepID=UPI002AAAC9A2|nr:serine hydrolase [Chitinophaga sp. LS1]WPV70271.1 serine hydrolase [Chitinophaga sp. LS1]